jgi:hypothetical protein
MLDARLFQETLSVEVGLALVASRINSPAHKRFAADSMYRYVLKNGNRLVQDRDYHHFIGSLGV